MEHFETHPYPTNIKPKSAVDPDKSKGFAVDRWNARFLQNVDSEENLIMAMGYQTFSRDQTKFGIEKIR